MMSCHAVRKYKYITVSRALEPMRRLNMTNFIDDDNIIVSMKSIEFIQRMFYL